MSAKAHDLTFEELVGKIYEGVTTPDAWQDALKGIGNRLFANSSLLIARDIQSLDSPRDQAGRDTVLATDGVNPLDLPAWETFRRLEPAARFVPNTPSGVADTPERLGVEDQARNNEFFSQFASRIGAHRSLYAWAPWPRDGVVLGIAFHREERFGPFEDQEREWVQKLVPHLTRAARLRRKLHLGVSETLEAEVLERLDYGLIAVDRELKVHWLNRRARRVLEDFTALRIDRSVLGVTDRRCSSELRRAVRSSLMQTDVSCQHGFCTESHDGQDAVRILVVPLRRRGLALVVLDHFVKRTNRAVRMAAREFGLTPAETRVVLELARGRTVKDAATLLKVSEGRARNCLKAALAKTGARRQSLLMTTVLGRADATWTSDE